MHGAGVGAANGDGHAADSDGQRVAAEGAEVKRFYGHAFVETELAKAAGRSLFKRRPVDGFDVRAPAELERIERDRKGMGRLRRVHLRLIINNERRREA
jgi:hypothetical protein